MLLFPDDLFQKLERRLLFSLVGPLKFGIALWLGFFLDFRLVFKLVVEFSHRSGGFLRELQRHLDMLFLLLSFLQHGRIRRTKIDCTRQAISRCCLQVLHLSLLVVRHSFLLFLLCPSPRIKPVVLTCFCRYCPCVVDVVGLLIAICAAPFPCLFVVGDFVFFSLSNSLELRELLPRGCFPWLRNRLFSRQMRRWFRKSRHAAVAIRGRLSRKHE
mmetsp:Transcript_11753/g.21490  ORF Transcript_11753/g.21490 Transcript_11753/m.21490 type:complete len:215 (-) Transcript_11753:160-804(-)